MREMEKGGGCGCYFWMSEAGNISDIWMRCSKRIGAGPRGGFEILS